MARPLLDEAPPEGTLPEDLGGALAELEEVDADARERGAAGG